MNARAPLLIVVTGMPGAGKTTLARALAEELLLPLVAKDDIKERLYDELGTGDVEWSRQLGRAAYTLIFSFLASLLAAGKPAIAEANFFRGLQEDKFGALPPHRLMQLLCSAPLELLVDRYADRTGRHPGHHDRGRLPELAARLESGAHAPLDLDGEVIEVDTSKAVPVQAIASRIRSSLHGAGLQPSA